MKPLRNILMWLGNEKRISERTGLTESAINKIVRWEKEPSKTQYAQIRGYLKQVNSYISTFIKESKPRL